jgi:hypothetical protein
MVEILVPVNGRALASFKHPISTKVSGSGRKKHGECTLNVTKRLHHSQSHEFRTQVAIGCQRHRENPFPENIESCRFWLGPGDPVTAVGVPSGTR